MSTSSGALDDLRREIEKDDREIDAKKREKQLEERETDRKRRDLATAEEKMRAIQLKIDELEASRMRNHADLENLQREIQKSIKG